MPSSLTAALAAGHRRVGWQYADPGDLRPSPLRSHRPVLNDPLPPSYAATDRAMGSVGRPRGGILAGVGFLGLVLDAPTHGVSLLLTLGCLVWFVWPWFARRRATASWKARRAVAREAYDADVAAWEREIAVFEAAEQTRVATATQWWPVDLRDDVERLDVVGGVPDGWRRLLATFGMSVVGTGASLLVVDLTEEHVGDGLVELAAGDGATAVRDVALPRDSDQLDVLEGLAGREIAEVLGEAVDGLRGDGGDRVAKAVDAEILGAVAGRLAAPPTAARLLAGLRVVMGGLATDDALSTTEIAALLGDRDALLRGATDKQLRFLAISVGRFASAAAESVGGDLWSPLRGLVVVRTEHDSPETKEATDRLVFHALLRRLRAAPPPTGATLILIAPDHLGADALERMAREARRRGVLLVFVFANLREEAQSIIGTSGSTAVFMRLGNWMEAKAAAEFIGRRHSFVLAAISREDTTGEASAGSDSAGTTTKTDGAFSVGVGLSSHSVSGKVSRSFSRSLTETAETMRSWSRSHSRSTGSTERRVYEFAVEPTELQSLPPTAFILVEGRAGIERAAAGDCNPAIALLDPRHVAQVRAEGLEPPQP